MFGFLVREEGVAVRHQDGTLTYGDFNTILAHLRIRLEDAGARPGDRVALIFPNSVELLAGYYACLLGGFVAVPINARLTPPEVNRVLRHSTPRVILTEPGRVVAFEEDWQRVAEAGAEGSEALLEIVGLEAIHGWADAGASKAPAPPIYAPPWPPEHPAILFYTSGTTGEPKGALYTHRTLTENCRIYTKGMQISASDHSVLCHCMASNFMFSQMTVPLLHLGGTVSITGFGNVEQTLDAIKAGATFLSLIPWFGFQLIEAARERGSEGGGAAGTGRGSWTGDDGSGEAGSGRGGRFQPNHLRTCAMGGDRIPLVFFQEFREVFGILPREHLGMTETNVYVVNPESESEIRVGSVGRVLEEVEVQIRGPSGEVLPPGERGEIWVRSGANIQGYWKDPVKTRETIVDGWLCTGDVAHFDEDGYLWFSGRTKHLIICDGDNLHPGEIENEINRHPAVARSSVFGVPHPTRGETVAAAVILRKAGTRRKPSDASPAGDGAAPTNPALSQEALADFLRDRVNEVKIPQNLLVLDAFPQTPIGKVDRKALLAMV